EWVVNQITTAFQASSVSDQVVFRPSRAARPDAPVSFAHPANSDSNGDAAPVTRRSLFGQGEGQFLSFRDWRGFVLDVLPRVLSLKGRHRMAPPWWFRLLKRHVRFLGRARTATFLPRLEALEDRAVPATFHVALTGNDLNNGSATAPFRTVQAAINAAAATADGPDVVQVEAGTYATAGVDLGLSIPSSANLQNLQLLGGYDAGKGFTTRTPRTTVYIPQTPGDRNLQDVNVANPNVTIDGFHFVFDGNGVGGTGGTRQSGGILSNTTGFVFNNNTIEVGLGRTPATSGARSLGIATTATD